MSENDGTPPGSRRESPLLARVDANPGNTVSGYVLDPSQLQKRFVVELWLDGHALRVAKADRYDHGLCLAGQGDGCYGFAFFLGDGVPVASLIEVRLANSDELLGQPFNLSLSPLSPLRDGDGWVAWQGGLRLSGWIREVGLADSEPIKAVLNGTCVAQARLSGWAHIVVEQNAVPVRAFDMHLPDALADGSVKYVHVLGPGGSELPGSPCSLIAFPDGLRGFLESRGAIPSERLRAEMFDRMFPQACPFTSFRAWAEAFPLPPTADIACKKVAVAIIGHDGLEASLDSLHAQVGCEWIAGAVGSAGDPFSFRHSDLVDFLSVDAADCDIVVFLLSGTVLQPEALVRFVSALENHPDAPLAYSDLAVCDNSSVVWPMFLTAFDYERTIEQGCGAYLFATRRDRVFASAATNVFSVYLADLDPAGAPRNKPIHIPGCLGQLSLPSPSAAALCLADAVRQHLRHRTLKAHVNPGKSELLPVVHVARASGPSLISVVLPVRNSSDLVATLSALIASAAGNNLDLIVVDNDSGGVEARLQLEQAAALGARITSVPGGFDWSYLMNAGAATARGEYLLLFGPHLRPEAPGWLTDLVGRLTEPDAGVVSPLIAWSSGVIREGGLVLGPRFDVAPAFSDRVDGDAGYGDLLRVAHECSAVSSCCFMTKRRLFRDHGGFDAKRFPGKTGSVDFCLAMRAKGYRVILSPHAKVRCHDPQHTDEVHRGDLLAADRQASTALRLHWGAALANDPYYHPMLALDGHPYSALAWPPRDTRPRVAEAGQPHRPPAGF